ncbi:hypothetical protein P171DRAFT_119600 [Karstenula rhodostoma CBS 690.94]|uniref:Protein kinase domain-containing protein n=1 Tax=Karstenula rhodostoma CBS 690.94 TaxID=1392251 RepID=A0A9P4PBR7_9PLEO|nr:hypothetical protein P171DRAFT_119600 [Karstenula rhodostoma CBS 690.94]
MQSNQSLSYTPYLKGFEHARAVTDITDREPLPDPENDVYRHPNRRGRETFRVDFHPIHDMYAVGTVLVEIGFNKPRVDAIKKTKDTPSPDMSAILNMSYVTYTMIKYMGSDADEDV